MADPRSRGGPDDRSRGGPDDRSHGRPSEAASRDLAVVGGLLALAAALRLPGLLARGTWDADQGNDMANLQRLVSDGVVPLLGPPTSIGDVHHGALYYYLLAPAALPSGGRDPLEVVAAIAVMGIAAVAVTWWLARSMGGPAAGLAAGLVAATSTTAVSSSTFLWNPNPIPLFAALAIGAAWRAWSTRRPSWWLVAAVGQGIVQQCHVLGIVALPAFVLLFVADLRRRPDERRRLAAFGVASLAIVAIGYLPLVINELTTGLSETHALLAWLTSGGSATAPGLPARLAFVPLRVAAWPLVGLVTDAPGPAVLAVVGLVAATAWRLLRATGDARDAVRWLAGYAALAILALAIFVPSMGVVTPLPTDHYHAFVGPAIWGLVGLGVAALWNRDTIGRVLAVAALTALVAWNLAGQPPPAAADGGWPAARDAGARLVRVAAGQPLAFVGVPSFKPTTAYTYPFAIAGGVVAPGIAAAPRVAVVCDDLFRQANGGPCGGQVEAAALAEALAAAGRPAGGGSLVERFSPAPGRTISVFLVGLP